MSAQMLVELSLHTKTVPGDKLWQRWEGWRNSAKRLEDRLLQEN